MQRINVTATGEDKGYSVAYPVVIKSVDGIDSRYGGGGFSVGVVPSGRSGRQVTQGPLIDGPWGYLYGLASIIDNHGGTKAAHDTARAEGRLIERLADGDVLVLDGQPFTVQVLRNEARLVPAS